VFTNALVLVAMLTMMLANMVTQPCRLCVAVSDYGMKVWLGMFFFVWSRTAVVFCNEVHKRREKVRGGERIDVRRNYTMSKVIMLFVCGCYEM
jgi:hypothetical protein